MPNLFEKNPDFLKTLTPNKNQKPKPKTRKNGEKSGLFGEKSVFVVLEMGGGPIGLAGWIASAVTTASESSGGGTAAAARQVECLP